jgi:spermidine/putrescine transport system substrate-binding protein
MLRPENAAVFTNLDTTANASAGSGKYIEQSIRQNFERSFPMKNIVNIKWYPPVPAKIESIEGKILDKVKAAK